MSMTMRNTMTTAHWFTAKRTSVPDWPQEARQVLASLFEAHETIPDAADHNFWHRTYPPITHTSICTLARVRGQTHGLRYELNASRAGVTTELNATTKHSKLRLFPGELCKIVREMTMACEHPEALHQTVQRALSEPVRPRVFVSSTPANSSRSNSIDEEMSMGSPRETVRSHATRSPIKRTLEEPDESAPSKRLARLGNMKRASSSPALCSHFLVGM
jgi:hypothetical protein